MIKKRSVLFLASAAMLALACGGEDPEADVGGTDAGEENEETSSGGASSSSGGSKNEEKPSQGSGGKQGSGGDQGGEPTEGSGGGVNGSGGDTASGGTGSTEDDGGVTPEPEIPECLEQLRGTPCDADGGGFCDGEGKCVQGFAVVRVGGGLKTKKDNRATSVFLEAYSLDGESLGSVGLPQAQAGANSPFSLTSNHSDEGLLALSGDGSALLLGGYGVAPGGLTDPRAASPSDVRRVVASVEADGWIDTTTILGSTSLSPFRAGSIRSVTSPDGQSLWIAGEGTTSSGVITSGVFSTTLGATSEPLQEFSSPVFSVQHEGGKLYASTTAWSPVFSLSAQDIWGARQAQALPGFSLGSGSSVQDFALLDTNPDVVGLDTLYIAQTNKRLLQKWSFDGVSWRSVYSFEFARGASENAVPRALTARVVGQETVLLVTIGGDGGADDVVRLRDDGASLQLVPFTASPTPFLSAPAETAYRGIAWLPRGWSKFSFDQEPSPLVQLPEGAEVLYVGQLGEGVHLVAAQSHVQSSGLTYGASAAVEALDRADGRRNAHLLVGTSYASPAATYCSALGSNEGEANLGSNWYLPGIDELSKITIDLQEFLPAVSSDFYLWSSTESSSSAAHALRLRSANLPSATTSTKTTARSVLCFKRVDDEGNPLPDPGPAQGQVPLELPEGGQALYVGTATNGDVLMAAYGQLRTNISWGAKGTEHRLSDADDGRNNIDRLKVTYPSYVRVAQNYCDSISSETLGGDWYVPAINELSQLRIKAWQAYLGTASLRLWSSTEKDRSDDDEMQTWRLNSGSLSMSEADKNSTGTGYGVLCFKRYHAEDLGL